MRKRAYLGCLLGSAFLLSSSLAQLHADEQRRISEKELHRRVKEAHTVDQYRELAEYCRAQETKYHSLAQEEHHELQRLEQGSIVWPSKPPTAIDATEHLYQYYSLKAEEMERFVTEL